MTRAEAEALAEQLRGEPRVGGAEVRKSYPERPKDILHDPDAYCVAFELLGRHGGASTQWWLIATTDAARELLDGA